MIFLTMMLLALQQIYCMVIFIFLNIELPLVIYFRPRMLPYSMNAKQLNAGIGT